MFASIMTIGINNVYAIKLNKNEMIIGVGNSETLRVTGSSSGSIRWTSTNTGIATVNNGVVTGKSIGTTYITVVDDTGTDVCKVTVASNYIEVTGIVLPKNGDTLIVGATKSINASVTPTNATNKTINYSSMNPGVAKVDSNGNVTGVSAGTTYISLTAGNKSALYKIDVINKAVNVKLSGISLPATYELEEGGSGRLSVTYNPSNATNKTVTWKSSDTSIVTVDGSGYLKALKSGSVTITATSKDGNHTATSKVTVNAVDRTLKGISLDKTELTMEMGKTQKLTIIYNPNNAANKNVTWRSTNSNIAKVENGVVTAIKPGKVEIKVISEEGGFQAACQVVVLSPPIESISFKNEINEVFLGDTTTLEIVSVPEDTMINYPIWTSSDETVATIDEYGNITGLALGTTSVTISDKEGKVTATTTVNVVERPDEKLVISVEGYNIRFDPDVKTYDITIAKEKSLKISLNRDPSKYVISGNHDLKNGSVITITVYGDEKVTYMLNIRKKEGIPLVFIIIISIILIANIIRILIKNKKNK